MARVGRFLSADDRVLAGVRDIVSVPNPAPGTDWSRSIPGGQMWRLLAGQHKFVTSATAGSRFPSIQLTVNGVVVHTSLSIVAYTAGLTFTIAFGFNISTGMSVTSGAHCTQGVAQLWLPPGSVIGSATGNIDVADQYSNIAMFMERSYVTDQDLSEYEQRFETDLAIAAAAARKTTGA